MNKDILLLKNQFFDEKIAKSVNICYIFTQLKKQLL